MIPSSLARLIVREHLYRPIEGSVLTLGRQTIQLDFDGTVDLMQDEGYSPEAALLSAKDVKYDQETRKAQGEKFINDETFFGLLGVSDLHSMDVSAYEGADFIHDLNDPVPETLHERFDFIIDGGSFDHLINLEAAFGSVMKMLKPGGRILQWNGASNHTGAAYVSPGPDLFFDYYVLNKFVDCKVYIGEIDALDQSSMWDLYQFDGTTEIGHFLSERILTVIVLAEKGSKSTTDQRPIQSYYRDENRRSGYSETIEMINRSARNSWTGHIPDEGALAKEKVRNVWINALKQIRKSVPKSVVDLVPLRRKATISGVLSSASPQTQVKDVSGYRYVGRV